MKRGGPRRNRPSFPMSLLSSARREQLPGQANCARGRLLRHYVNPPEAEVTGSNPVGRTENGKVYYREADLNVDRRDERGGRIGPRSSILSGVLKESEAP